MSRFLGNKLVIATHNEGKLREFRALLAPYEVEVTSAGALGVPEPEETGTTFIENARIKARATFEATGLPALADDSGLCVSALDGAPGLFSARWAGPEKDYALAMKKIHEAMGAAPDRSAFFFCALALIDAGGRETLIKGRVDGQIVWPPRGEGGMGYDPFFQPDGHDKTFAEMPPAEKSAMSHRGRALRELVGRCFEAS